MAETVGLHIESMIPELEQMRRLGLFSAEEIQGIVKKRKEFEYKIARNTKEKSDFLRYINYEVKLLREIKLRRDRHHLSEKKSEIEYAIAKNIVKIYQLSLSYFKSDVKMWFSYINFCTQTRFTHVAPQAFKQMLQVHGDKKNVWIFAAKWELSESQNVEGALNYLKTGIHHHPDSKELYAEAFRLEIKCGTLHSPGATPEEIKTKEDKALRRASVHFKVAVNKIGNDIEFMINLLEIATEYRYTDELQLEMVDYMTKACWNSELMYHHMAHRELNGHHYNKNDSHKNKTLLCIAVYKLGVQIIPTEEMWAKYLDTLIEISCDEKRKHTLKQSLLLATFEEGFNGQFLKEQHYLYWLEMLNNDPKYPEILNKATKALPKSVEIWLSRLKYYAAKDDAVQFKNIGMEAIKALESNALQIYRTLIKYYQLKSTGGVFCHEVKQVFEEGISRSEPEISQPLRPQYIEWLAIGRSIKLARNEYEKISAMPPFCLELHKKMVDIEMGRFTPCISRIRSIHKTACQQFGNEKTEVWMDFIKFELEIGEPSNVPDIYNQAKNSLQENLVSIFTTDFAILNTQ